MIISLFSKSNLWGTEKNFNEQKKDVVPHKRLQFSLRRADLSTRSSFPGLMWRCENVQGPLALPGHICEHKFLVRRLRFHSLRTKLPAHIRMLPQFSAHHLPALTTSGDAFHSIDWLNQEIKFMMNRKKNEYFFLSFSCFVFVFLSFFVYILFWSSWNP